MSRKRGGEEAGIKMQAKKEDVEYEERQRELRRTRGGEDDYDENDNDDDDDEEEQAKAAPPPPPTNKVKKVARRSLPQQNQPNASAPAVNPFAPPTPAAANPFSAVQFVASPPAPVAAAAAAAPVPAASKDAAYYRNVAELNRNFLEWFRNKLAQDASQPLTAGVNKYMEYCSQFENGRGGAEPASSFFKPAAPAALSAPIAAAAASAKSLFAKPPVEKKAKEEEEEEQPKSKSLFGAAVPPPPAADGGLFSAAAPSGGLFGAAAPPSGGLFGAAPPASSGGGLFGTAPPATGGGLFGTAPPPAASGGGLFGSSAPTSFGGAGFSSTLFSGVGGAAAAAAAPTGEDDGEGGDDEDPLADAEPVVEVLKSSNDAEDVLFEADEAKMSMLMDKEFKPKGQGRVAFLRDKTDTTKCQLVVRSPTTGKIFFNAPVNSSMKSSIKLKARSVLMMTLSFGLNTDTNALEPENGGKPGYYRLLLKTEDEAQRLHAALLGAL